jgi:large subunit ribosomal protein L29
MANLRSDEIRAMDAPEKEKHLAELQKALMKIKGGIASGGVPEDIGKTREIRKTISRILTIKNQEGKEKKK